MKNVNPEGMTLKKKIIDSGTVVYDPHSNWEQKFPTETEADEFIAAQIEEVVDENNRE